MTTEKLKNKTVFGIGHSKVITLPPKFVKLRDIKVGTVLTLALVKNGLLIDVKTNEERGAR